MPPTFSEIGLAGLASMYCELSELGKAPPVIDAEDLRKDPEVCHTSACSITVSLYYANFL